MRNIGIIGIGHYVPSRVVTNKELSKTIDTTDEWIFQKVGIRERRIADSTEATSDLGIYAAQEALRSAKCHAEDIDLLIVATSSPDMIQPSTASIIQGKISALNSAAFDVSAVCAGFVYALTIASTMMKGDARYKKALVIASETYSRILDWQDRNTCVFFGDGAGAVVLGDVDNSCGIENTYLRNDGRGATIVKFPGGGSRYPATLDTLAKNMHKFEMDGKKVWDFATTMTPLVVKSVLEEVNENIANIDWIITHQANINIIKEILKRLNIPMEKTYTNVDVYGNTSGASTIIALSEAYQKGYIKRGDKVVLTGFGGGWSFGAVYMKWGKIANERI